MSNLKYILAIDQSTSASKVMLFDHKAQLIKRVSKDHKQYYPQPGYVEHDPEEIFENVKQGMLEVVELAKISIESIEVIAITNQRETTVLWDRNTGKAVHRAIVWQDRRTADRCQELKDAGKEPLFRQRTGLVLDPYLAGTKLEWLLDNVDGARSRAEAGELACGTIDSWLVYNLSGRKTHVTDVTNASRMVTIRLPISAS